MSKLLTIDDKLALIKTMCKSFSKEQVEHLDRVENVHARYKCAQRYLRELNEGKTGEKKKALIAYRRYGAILEGLECIDDKLWTDEAKIMAFGKVLESYSDKCAARIDEVNRRHLERLKSQRDQHKMEYEAAQAKYDKEIAELEKKLG